MRWAMGVVPPMIRRTAGRKAYATAGTSFEYRNQSEDDATLRKTCTRCGFVDYENPKVVCGSVLTLEAEDLSPGGVSDTRIVLGRRTIEPRRGFWGIPAGFLEMGETVEEGAVREAREELNAEIDVGGLLAVYSLPHIGQVQMIYSSSLQDTQGMDARPAIDRLSAGQETDMVASFRWEDIPWDSLAFPTTSWALWHHHRRTQALRRSSSLDRRDSLGSGKAGTPLGAQQQQQQRERGEVHGGVGDSDRYGGGGEEGGGDGSGATSPGSVFSAPGSNIALFWSPLQGLHVKEDWKMAVDC